MSFVCPSGVMGPVECWALAWLVSGVDMLVLSLWG